LMIASGFHWSSIEYRYRRARESIGRPTEAVGTLRPSEAC
jgi:hypothetical protein